MNYVRSLWILHCRGWCPICPSFPGSDKTATGTLSHWHSRGKPVSQCVYCGGRGFRRKRERKRSSSGGMRSAEWTKITSWKPKEDLFQPRREISTKKYQFWRQNNWHKSISILLHNLLVLLLITFTLLLLLTFLSAIAVSCYFSGLRFHLLPPFPAAQQKHNWIAPHRPW